MSGSRDCSQPDLIGEGDLMAFVEGAASSAVRAHVAVCAACRREAAGLREMNARFRAAYRRQTDSDDNPPR